MIVIVSSVVSQFPLLLYTRQIQASIRFYETRDQCKVQEA